MLSNPIIEQEIQNHKNKLNILISKLINTHDIDEETSINNTIKNETEFLSSLLNIKKNELNHIKMNMHINPMQQQIMMKQQMMDPQMIQMQMMMAQAQQEQMKNILNNQRKEEISVTFRRYVSEEDEKYPVVAIIQCTLDEKVSSLIEKYRNNTGDHDSSKKFIFNARNLNLSLTVAEAGITNKANIFVVNTKMITKEKK